MLDYSTPTSFTIIPFLVRRGPALCQLCEQPMNQGDTAYTLQCQGGRERQVCYHCGTAIFLWRWHGQDNRPSVPEPYGGPAHGARPNPEHRSPTRAKTTADPPPVPW